jgi:hypothetical protein
LQRWHPLLRLHTRTSAELADRRAYGITPGAAELRREASFCCMRSEELQINDNAQLRVMESSVDVSTNLTGARYEPGQRGEPYPVFRVGSWRDAKDTGPVGSARTAPGFDAD